MPSWACAVGIAETSRQARLKAYAIKGLLDMGWRPGLNFSMHATWVLWRMPHREAERARQRQHRPVLRENFSEDRVNALAASVADQLTQQKPAQADTREVLMNQQ